MSIFYFTPFSQEKDIGKAYNEYMRLIPNSTDYVCFVDADAMFLTYTYGNQIHDIIKKYKNIRLFTCITNRINCKFQQAKVNKFNNDIAYHRALATEYQEQQYDNCSDVTNKGLMSGVLILLQKSLWEQVGGFLENGTMLGVDNSIHKKTKDIGEKVYLMNGVYIYHWYRGGGKDYSHLLKK